jgi:hypothetical protein
MRPSFRKYRRRGEVRAVSFQRALISPGGNGPDFRFTQAAVVLEPAVLRIGALGRHLS